jgi:hypothetical protein
MHNIVCIPEGIRFIPDRGRVGNRTGRPARRTADGAIAEVWQRYLQEVSALATQRERQ